MVRAWDKTGIIMRHCGHHTRCAVRWSGHHAPPRRILFVHGHRIDGQRPEDEKYG